MPRNSLDRTEFKHVGRSMRCSSWSGSNRSGEAPRCHPRPVWRYLAIASEFLQFLVQRWPASTTALHLTTMAPVYVLRQPEGIEGEAHIDMQTNKNILGGRCRRARCVLSAQNFIESLLSSPPDGTPKPEDSVDENGIRTTVEYVINDEGKKVKVCLVQLRSSTSTIFCLHFPKLQSHPVAKIAAHPLYFPTFHHHILQYLILHRPRTSS